MYIISHESFSGHGKVEDTENLDGISDTEADLSWYSNSYENELSK